MRDRDKQASYKVSYLPRSSSAYMLGTGEEAVPLLSSDVCVIESTQPTHFSSAGISQRASIWRHERLMASHSSTKGQAGEQPLVGGHQGEPCF